MTNNNLTDAVSNNYALKINDLPGVAFRGVGTNTPGLTAGVSEVSAIPANIPNPAGKIEFDVFTVRFIVDEDFENWKAIFDWILRTTSYDDVAEVYSDVSLLIPNAHGKEGLAFRYTNAWPVSLDPIDLSSQSQPDALICSVSFKYQFVEVDIS